VRTQTSGARPRPRSPTWEQGASHLGPIGENRAIRPSPTHPSGLPSRLDAREKRQTEPRVRTSGTAAHEASASQVQRVSSRAHDSRAPKQSIPNPGPERALAMWSTEVERYHPNRKPTLLLHPRPSAKIREAVGMSPKEAICLAAFTPTSPKHRTAEKSNRKHVETRHLRNRGGGAGI
jgi:hypothetical protein